MKFLRLIFLFLATCIFVYSFSQSSFSQPLKNKEIRGVWLTNIDSDVLFSQEKTRSSIESLHQLNFNTIYPTVWNWGYTLYPSQVAKNITGIKIDPTEGLQNRDLLAEIITQAHAKKMAVIPWFEFGFMTSPSSELALNHPQWLTSRQDGIQTWEGAAGEVVWLNPFHPEVQQLITNLVLEVMTQYQGDGIQFDDHLSLPIEFGYDPYTVKLYQQQTKALPPKDPRDPAWVRWRANKITEFVEKLHKTVKAKNPKAIFSVAPNPYHTAYNSHLQDWVSWVKKNLVDELIVQIYRPDLPSFTRELVKPEIQEARGKIPTGAGILTGLRNRPIGIQQIQAKIKAARQNGLGFSFFFYESLWDEAPEPANERKAKFQSLFYYPASRAFLR